MFGTDAAVIQAPNATVPALVADGKVYDSTKTCIEWMVEYSSVKGIAPGSSLVDKLHADTLDPNFAFLASVRPFNCAEEMARMSS